MVEEIAFENSGQIFNFDGLVTLTMDRVALHTIVHHSSTSTYLPNIIDIEETLWADGRAYTWTDGHLRPTLLGRLTRFNLRNTPSATYSAAGNTFEYLLFVAEQRADIKSLTHFVHDLRGHVR